MKFDIVFERYSCGESDTVGVSACDIPGAKVTESQSKDTIKLQARWRTVSSKTSEDGNYKTLEMEQYYEPKDEEDLKKRGYTEIEPHVWERVSTTASWTIEITTMEQLEEVLNHPSVEHMSIWQGETEQTLYTVGR